MQVRLNNLIIEFGINEVSSCVFYFSTGAGSCVEGSRIDADYYRLGFNVIKTPSSTDTIIVSQGTTTCYDASTGVTTTCASSSPSWDAVNSVCNNAVYKVSWKVLYSVSAGKVSIESIVVDTVLKRVSVTDYSGTNLEFSISFVEVRIQF